MDTKAINDILYRKFFYVYGILFFFIPIPVFFDFGSMSFIVFNVGEYSAYQRPVIPFPVGAVALICALILGYFLSLIRPLKMVSVFSVPQILLFFLFYVGFFGVIVWYFVGLSAPRLVQLVLPAVFFSLISFPSQYLDKIFVVKCYVWGLSFLFVTHAISLVINSNDPLSVHPSNEFPWYFGYLVYQSLVSYPGVISLSLFLVLALLFRQLSKSPLVKDRFFTFALMLLLICQVYLGFASGRRAFLVESMSAVFLVSVLGALFASIYGVIKKRVLFLYLLFIFFSILLAFLYLSSGLSSRFLASLDAGTIDSGRGYILTQAFQFFYQNPKILFFGAGGSGAPGMHNFFLDQIYRIGLAGTAVSYLVFAFVVRRFFVKNNNFIKFSCYRFIFLLVLFSGVFWQSMINASISQPFYLVNVIACFSMMLFVVFQKQNRILKRSDR